MTIFSHASDYAAFMDLLREVLAEVPLRILAFCLMPNHWHFVVLPESSAQVACFMQRLTTTHAVRWRLHQGTVGNGPVYQGRFKSFVIEGDIDAMQRVCRYVERNALRAGLVERAEDWPWGSLWHRVRGNPGGLLAELPYPLPSRWVDVVNDPMTDAELEALRACAQRGAPYGRPDWVAATAESLGLTSALRPRGRPRKGV